MRAPRGRQDAEHHFGEGQHRFRVVGRDPVVAGERDLETAAFTVFLYGRMIGAAAEIDDHLNRGRNMDTRLSLIHI